MRIQVLEETMERWHKWFKELDIPFILNQSVILGIHREKRLFPNERVMEFAILGSDLTDEKFNRLVTEEKYQYRAENTHEAQHGLLYFRDIEVQPIYFKKGKAVYNLIDDECLVYDEDLLQKENWGTIRYKNIDWNVPKDIERFLTQAYGDWKTPNPAYNWKDHANNKMKWNNI